MIKEKQKTRGRKSDENKQEKQRQRSFDCGAEAVRAMEPGLWRRGSQSNGAETVGRNKREKRGSKSNSRNSEQRMVENGTYGAAALLALGLAGLGVGILVLVLILIAGLFILH